jgi:hypothetical protein
MADGRSAAERLLSARQSSQLRLLLDTRCSADTLLAAAYATAGDARKSAALAVYSILSSERMVGAQRLADQMAGWIRRKAWVGRGRPTIPRVIAIDIAMAVLKWWHHPTCPTCEGHGHPRLPGTPTINTARTCTPCNGMGQVQLHHIVAPEHVWLAQWLSDKIASMCSFIFDDIARRLAVSMEEFS